MRLRIFFAALAVLTPLVGSAQAGFLGIRGVQANDTGGIIPWSPLIARHYREIAAAECARWNKVAFITSVSKKYGDYVGFACHFPRGYDPRKGFFPPPALPWY